MSRKAVTIFAGAFCTALVLVAATAAPGPAVIISPGFFVGFDANGTPLLVPAENGQIVITNSANGNVNAHGTARLPDGAALPSKTMHWNNANTGFTCQPISFDFKAITTPSGHVTLNCHGP